MAGKFEIGDVIRILEPEMFHKCRYEKDFMDFYVETTMGDKEVIEKMVSQFVVKDILNDTIGDRGFIRLENGIASGIASFKLERYKATGAKKVITTLRINYLENKVFVIYDISKVATGEYVAESGGYDQHSESYDYIPAQLINRKYHNILHIVEYAPINLLNNRPPAKFKIEDINCRYLGRKETHPPEDFQESTIKLITHVTNSPSQAFLDEA